ncbi:MAG: hypothetical protein H0V89_08910, partial [Deltaproteobacteria bacterium]|nr:hypothetical protein [Deltaproteobacteria bacterium]
MSHLIALLASLLLTPSSACAAPPPAPDVAAAPAGDAVDVPLELTTLAVDLPATTLANLLGRRWGPAADALASVTAKPGGEADLAFVRAWA